MFNGYCKHPKRVFKCRRTACSIVFLIAFFILISSGSEDFTVDAIKDAACIAAIAIAAVVGKLDNIKEKRRDEM